ncbi:MAG: hypothetical protein AAF226_03445 [Verrucomicrobiota bacterium]
MRPLLPILILLLTSITVLAEDHAISNFFGEWVTDPFHEVMEDGIEEQIADIEAGSHPLLLKLDDNEAKELLKKSKAEMKEDLESLLSMMIEMIKDKDLRFGCTLSENSIYMFIEAQGEREGVKQDATYEISENHLICKHEDGPTLFEIKGKTLLTKNDKTGSYPKMLTLNRSTHKPKAESSAP